MPSALHRMLLASHRPACAGPLIDALRPLIAAAAAVTPNSPAAARHFRTAAAAQNILFRRPMSATARPAFLSYAAPKITTAAFGASTFGASASPPPGIGTVAAASAFAAATFGVAAYATFFGDGCGSSPAQAERGIKFLPAGGDTIAWEWEEGLEHDWDDFMIKSVRPGEDDGDDEEEDKKEGLEDEDQDEEDDDDDDENEADQGSKSSEVNPEQTKAVSPRPTSTQEEYVHSCELSVPSENYVFERHFWSTEHESANDNIELTEWNKYIESTVKTHGKCDEDEEEDDDEEGFDDQEDEEEEHPVEDVLPAPEAVMAAARVRLHDEATGYPIRVAYVRDHNDRLLGVKRFEDVPPCDRSMGRCPFVLKPGQTGSVRVFVIYEAGGPAGTAGREHHGRRLYYSPPIPIPSVPRKFDADEDEGDEKWVPCA